MTCLAVVVTYNPDAARLAALLDGLDGEECGIVVVDNGSDADVAALVAARRVAREEVIALGTNLGVAAAQNRGIEIARRRGCRHVILFDQDSVPAPGMVGILRRAAEERLRRGERVAAIGPSIVDPRLGRPLRPAAAGGIAPDGLVETDHVIASGCLIPLATLREVGAMQDELFVDCVDLEWCLRARAKGFRTYVSPEAQMSHAFGEPTVVLGRTLVWRPPLRHYYYFRNSVWLLRQPWVPAGWRLRSGMRVLRRLGVCLLLMRPRRAQWAMAWRGIRDGLAGRLGKGPA